jgi:hypothetical protein
MEMEMEMKKEVVAVLEMSAFHEPQDHYRVEVMRIWEVFYGGVPHYLSHPLTQKALEDWGAVPASSEFAGLEVGQAIAYVPQITQDVLTSWEGLAPWDRDTMVQVATRIE